MEVFQRCAAIDDIVIAADPSILKQVEALVLKYELNKVSAIVPGGQERADSVLVALSALSDDTDLVAIHDGARPLITEGIIAEAVKTAKRFGAAVVAVPAKDTMKVANKKGQVEKTLPREKLWHAQTPQVFEREILLKAYLNPKRRQFTDDSSLVEAMGEKVQIVPGDYRNLKITTAEDVAVAEEILKIC